MKSFYYIHFDGRKEPGVCKKIDAQIHEFSNYFSSVREINIKDTNHAPTITDKIKNNTLILYTSKYDYDRVLDEILDSSIVYIRRNKADKYYVRFISKLKEKGCTVLIEVPTYPYFKDDYCGLKRIPAFFKEVYASHQFINIVDRFVTYTNDKEIFGVPTIKVKNGIYVDQVQPRTPQENNTDVINLLAVATFRKHHGYERVINGIINYYHNGGNRNIVLRMIGDGEEKQRYVNLVNKNNMENHVMFFGKMIGEDLSKQYDIADIALGSFGMHKIDVYSSSVLKVREYLAKGLPIISGCHEDAFEDEKFPYYLEFSNDNSTIDVERIIEFYDSIYRDLTAEEQCDIVEKITQYAKRHINYDVVFKNVINYLNEE